MSYSLTTSNSPVFSLSRALPGLRRTARLRFCKSVRDSKSTGGASSAMACAPHRFSQYFADVSVTTKSLRPVGPEVKP